MQGVTVAAPLSMQGVRTPALHAFPPPRRLSAAPPPGLPFTCWAESRAWAPCRSPSCPQAPPGCRPAEQGGANGSRGGRAAAKVGLGGRWRSGGGCRPPRTFSSTFSSTFALHARLRRCCWPALLRPGCEAALCRLGATTGPARAAAHCIFGVVGWAGCLGRARGMTAARGCQHIGHDASAARPPLCDTRGRRRRSHGRLHKQARAQLASRMITRHVHRQWKSVVQVEGEMQRRQHAGVMLCLPEQRCSG